MIGTNHLLEDLIFVLETLREETRSMSVKTFAGQTLRRAKQVAREYALGFKEEPVEEPVEERSEEELAAVRAANKERFERYRERMRAYNLPWLKV